MLGWLLSRAAGLLRGVLARAARLGALLAVLPRDLRFACNYLRVFADLFYFKTKDTDVFSLLERQARLHPRKVCFLHDDNNWTFYQVENYARRVSRVFRKQLLKGDVVALLMTNRVEYPCIWLGLSRLGVISALINFNQKSSSLIHSLNLVKPKCIIYSPNLSQALLDIRDSLEDGIAFYCLGEDSTMVNTNMNILISQTEPDYVPVPKKVHFSDPLLYIYTSGTTGFPKAAIFTNSRFLFLSSLLSRVAGLNTKDIIYCSLPLYHTAGGVLGVCSAITLGGSLVIRTKFSASSYISDCSKYNCTVGQYIGEVCRYVLSTPQNENDTRHSLRMILGNGLTEDVWRNFVNRFKIPKVIEFYGSTEGNVALLNTEGVIGSCGFIPKWIPGIDKFVGVIIKVDEDMKPVRNEKGLCIKVKDCEPGMMVGIITSSREANSFRGYANKEDQEKKIIKDVLNKGDMAFFSGDLLEKDEQGFIYFKDRTGDTFRWKGENVATTEVEMVLREFSGLSECAVFGVKVGNKEGRAGMAVLVEPVGSLDLLALASYLDKTLPRYAQPIFLRSVSSLEHTGTSMHLSSAQLTLAAVLDCDPKGVHRAYIEEYIDDHSLHIDVVTMT